MGCAHPIPAKLRLDPTTKSSASDQINLIEPDPDYRWIQVSVAMMVNDACCLSSSPQNFDDVQDWIVNSSKKSLQETSSYPNGWTVFCLNARSSRLCRLSLINLAINISIRAKQLAETFGVSNDSADVPGTVEPAVSRESSGGERSRRQIYRELNTPDFGWVLVLRDAKNATKEQYDRFMKKKDDSDRQDEQLGNPPVNLQLLRSGTGREFYADTPTIGMNIAEQLYRLERNRDKRQFVPIDTFGWTVDEAQNSAAVNHAVLVQSPKGEMIPLVPEEMIMNVTQWVQQTYLTSVQF